MIDSHIHLSDPKLLLDVEALIERAESAGVTQMICICTDQETANAALILKEHYPEKIFLVASTTPHDAESLGDSDFSYMEDLARRGDLVAIGETGLEYYYMKESSEVQKALFVRYLELAKELSLPIVIHCREGFHDFFTLIDQFPEVRGVLHCFTGTIQEAEELIKRGWYLSFSGIVTYKKSLLLQEVAKNIPLDHILIETDAPYLAPQSKRGKTNESAYLPEIAQKIADLKGISRDLVEEVTIKNTKQLFKI
ncbi:TatD family hydrolase [Chlamydiales bacterium]|nr:TatD family hydrolase [Chlamydiales bacterium]